MNKERKPEDYTEAVQELMQEVKDVVPNGVSHWLKHSEWMDLYDLAAEGKSIEDLVSMACGWARMSCQDALWEIDEEIRSLSLERDAFLRENQPEDFRIPKGF